MRGLKQHISAVTFDARRSHLLQMRGLKPRYDGTGTCEHRSHLLQMRGLKPIGLDFARLEYLVASFTDAWIETRRSACPYSVE